MCAVQIIRKCSCGILSQTSLKLLIIKEHFPISENGPQETSPFETLDESELVQSVQNGQLGGPVLCSSLKFG